MPVDYIRSQYFWIPRIYGQDPETGTYVALPAGGWQFISDQDPATIPFTPAVGLQQRALHLPASFPRQAYFVGCDFAPIANNPSGVNECVAWIDPGGVFFNSGDPHGAEANSIFTTSIPLFSTAYSGGDIRQDFQLNYPILLDRDAGDLLCVKLGLSQYQDITKIGFNFLVPNPYPAKP